MLPKTALNFMNKTYKQHPILLSSGMQAEIMEFQIK